MIEGNITLHFVCVSLFDFMWAYLTPDLRLGYSNPPNCSHTVGSCQHVISCHIKQE